MEVKVSYIYTDVKTIKIDVWSCFVTVGRRLGRPSRAAFQVSGFVLATTGQANAPEVFRPPRRAYALLGLLDYWRR
jgi:hypothetical protein